MSKLKVGTLLALCFVGVSAQAQQVWPERSKAVSGANGVISQIQFSRQVLAGQPGTQTVVHVLDQISSLSRAISTCAMENREYYQCYAPFSQLLGKFMNLREQLHNGSIQMNSESLDAWYDVAFAVKHVRAAFPSAPASPDRLSFRGMFESTPVAFEGNTREELARDCAMHFPSDERNIDDINIAGTSYHKASGFWSKEALCALVVLNAQGQTGNAVLIGKIEDSPLQIRARENRQLDAVIAEFVPTIVRSVGNVDDLQINGRSYHKASGFWDLPAVVALLQYNTEPAVRMPVRAAGLIEDSPYVFKGVSLNDISAQCSDYMSKLRLGNIDDVTVNGRRLHKDAGFWSPAQLCEVIRASTN